MTRWSAVFVVDGDVDVLMDRFAQLMNEYPLEATLFDSSGDLVLTNGNGGE